MANYNSNNNRGNPNQSRDEDGQFKSSGNQQGTQHRQSAGSNQGGSQQNNPANFANDRQKASEAGRKGGENSHGGQGEKNDSDW